MCRRETYHPSFGDGQLVNQPSDGGERNVTTSVLVLPGSDPGEA
jgi:hypothetical protein